MLLWPSWVCYSPGQAWNLKDLSGNIEQRDSDYFSTARREAFSLMREAAKIAWGKYSPKKEICKCLSTLKTPLLSQGLVLCFFSGLFFVAEGE